MKQPRRFITLAAVAILAATVAQPSARGQGSSGSGDELEQELDGASSSKPPQDSVESELELGGLDGDGSEAAVTTSQAVPPSEEPSLGEAAPPEPTAQAAPPVEGGGAQAGAQPPGADELSLEESAPVEAASASPADPKKAADNSKTKAAAANEDGGGPLFDSPNRAMEERLHRIYGRNMDPIPEDRWDMMIAPRRSEMYRIRQGNTLSGISTALFGDPSYWPKLWSENGSFENPHLIVPGKSVRIVPGSEEDAPAVVLIDPSDQAASLDLPAPSYEVEQEGAVSPDEAIASTVLEEMAPDEPSIPDPEQVSRNPMRNLPPSFISAEEQNSDEYDRTGLEVMKSRAATVPASIIPTHYWVDEVPASVGSVAEIEASEEVAGVLQNVLLKMKSPASIGQVYSIVIPSGRPRKGALASGRVLEVGGVVEIIGTADREQNLYRAMVVKVVGAISKGSLVLSEKLPRADFSRRGNLKNVETEVIGGQYENDRKAFAAGSVIYLGAGTASGLSPGDVLAIRSRRGARWESTKFPKVASPIAVAKIIHSQTNGATAFVIEAEQEVVPGDHTGGGLPQPSRRTFILDRARIVDIEQQVAADRARREKFSDWKGKKGR